MKSSQRKRPNALPDQTCVVKAAGSTNSAVPALLMNYGGALVVIVAVVLIYSFLPLATAFQFGEDEGYELIKAFLHFKGYVLYKEIWSDQPPLFTLLLSSSFHLFGSSVLSARLVAAGFGLVLMGSFHELVRRRSGPWHALSGSFFLLAAPTVLLLSVSAMQEVAAIGTALLSTWFLFQWNGRRHWGWLAASGIVMGLALQIKFTAAVVLPSFSLELLLLCLKAPVETPETARPPAGANQPVFRSLITRIWQRDTSVSFLILSACVALVCTVVGQLWAQGSLHIAMEAHTVLKDVPGIDPIESYKFDPWFFQNHTECMIAGGVCVIVAIWQKRLREIAFPTMLLLTTSLIHAVHKPWFNYYYIHLAVPLAWLTGWCVNEVIQYVLRNWTRRAFNLTSTTTWKYLALCGLAALAIVRSERRLEASIKNLREQPRADANPIVKKMKEYAGQTLWVYAEHPIYTFHAQLLARPQLAIVSPKRLWSNQIATQEIIDVCMRETPGLLVLPGTTSRQVWTRLLEQYAPVHMDKENILYVDHKIAK